MRLGGNGSTIFSPDFSVRLMHEGRELRGLVEVKYRSSVDQFVSVENQRGERSVFATARRQWPDLCFVFVTDRPQPGRSCFQAIYVPEHPHENSGCAVSSRSSPRCRLRA